MIEPLVQKINEEVVRRVSTISVWMRSFTYKSNISINNIQIYSGVTLQLINLSIFMILGNK